MIILSKLWTRLRERTGCHEPEELRLWQWPSGNAASTCKYCHRGIVHDGNGGWCLWDEARN